VVYTGDGGDGDGIGRCGREMLGFGCADGEIEVCLLGCLVGRTGLCCAACVNAVDYFEELHMNLAGKIVGVLIVAACVIGFKFIRKGDTGVEARVIAHQVVAEADVYEANKEYMDWLVDNAHEQVFSSAYHMDYSRRGSRSYLDGDEYIDKLLENMIETAKNAKATTVVASLERLRDGEEAPPEKPKPQPVKVPGQG